MLPFPSPCILPLPCIEPSFDYTNQPKGKSRSTVTFSFSPSARIGNELFVPLRLTFVMLFLRSSYRLFSSLRVCFMRVCGAPQLPAVSVAQATTALPGENLNLLLIQNDLVNQRITRLEHP